MEKRSKLLAVLLVIIMVFSLVACNGNTTSGDTASSGEHPAAKRQVVILQILQTVQMRQRTAHLSKILYMSHNTGAYIVSAWYNAGVKL